MSGIFASSQARRNRQEFQEACGRAEAEESERDVLFSRRGRLAMEDARELRDLVVERLRLGTFPEKRASDSRLVRNLNAGLRDPQVARAWLIRGRRALTRLMAYGAGPSLRELAAARQERA